MGDLAWDDDLAAIAQSYASQCKFEHYYDHDLGENIFLGWADAWKGGAFEANEASQAWYSEIANVDDKWKCITISGKKTCGHYSQMVWRSTTKIGCAMTKGCDIWGYSWTLVFCEYKEAGNVMKEWDSVNEEWIPEAPYRK